MRPTDDQLNLSLPSWWFKIFGIVFVLGGFAALLVPAIAGIAVELLLGWLFFIGGCIQVGVALSTRRHESFWFEFLWAILFLIVGLWLLMYPAEGIQALAFIVGMLFIIEGIMKIIYSWYWRSQSKIGWVAISGILSIAIAMILLSGWPQQSAALLGILVGINLLASGTVAVLLSFGADLVRNTKHEKNNSESES
ncbi:MAG: HdeD family acid-resistance protein [Nitrosomonas sp.]|jgi:uncharacterized membrane protein HdeD (DUF308 family)|nr:HdeD family acid-resistance protein [Nitrosomonas sp.]